MAHDHDDMVWRANAVETVRSIRESTLATHPTETVPIDEIGGRTLAEGIVAETDIPEHDHATMDGYAFDASEDYPFTVLDGETFPEDEPRSIDSGEAVEIATGASLPPEANAVLKREESEVTDGQLTGAEIEPGTYTYERGSNVTAGEQLFEAGESLSAKDAIFLGDLGYDEVTVHEQFSTGVLATGTEIHENRQQDLDSPMLCSLVRSWGHEATYEGTVPDEEARVVETLSDLTDAYDIVITTGGTSVGHKDYVVQALSDLGEVHFHRVRLRPGKPIAVATVDDSVVFAIPGKPLGAHTVSTLVMGPFFTGQSALPSVAATMAVDIDLGPDGFEYAIPVTLSDGTAMPLGHVESPLSVYERTFDPSVLSSSTRATRADGFVLTRSPLSGGETVDVVPYPVVE